MKLKNAIPSLAAAVLAAVPIAHAQNATTDPVGFVTYTVNAQSDQRIGTPLQRESIYSGTSSSVNGTTISAVGLASLTGSNFLVVTSGSAAGKWESISSSTAGSLTLASPIGGFAANDSFAVKPYWTLNSLFPNGGSIPPTVDVFDPASLILVYNPSAVGTNFSSSGSFMYHSGSVDYPAGWYDASDPDSGLKNDVLLSPETSFTIRNTSGSSIQVTMVGNVPTSKFALDVVSRSGGSQDNLVYNKFPADVTLGASDLVSSGAVSPTTDVFDPQDLVLMYRLNNNGTNPSSSSQFFYHSGSADYVAGWYDASDPDSGVKNSTVIPAGAAIIIRKVAGPNASTAWNPSTPYSLQ